MAHTAPPHTVSLAVIGAGRIGQIHAHNMSRMASTEVRYVYDRHGESAQALASQVGAQAPSELEAVMNDPDVKGVLICSPTSTHADLIELAAGHGKAVFCEKPIDLKSERVAACAAKLGTAAANVQLGFNRRFDPTHAAVQTAIVSGSIGQLQQINIISRDPSPPPASYVASSGGMFRDMTIHDFDMARFLTADEPLAVTAFAACLVDDGLREAGDYDTANLVLQMRSGAIVTIANTRNCAHGYDQRIEAFGSTGMVQSDNRPTTFLKRFDADTTAAGVPYQSFFQDRYSESYRIEAEHFVSCLLTGTQPSVQFDDGVKALQIADAAAESARTGQTVRLG